jgi:hypothetical protein
MCLHRKETKEGKIGTGTGLGQTDVKQYKSCVLYCIVLCCVLCDDGGVCVCVWARASSDGFLVRVDQANSKILPSSATPMVFSDAISSLIFVFGSHEKIEEMCIVIPGVIPTLQKKPNFPHFVPV